MNTRMLVAGAALCLVGGGAVWGLSREYRHYYEKTSDTLEARYAGEYGLASAPDTAPVKTEKGLRVPILVYHSVRPYYKSQTPLQKMFDVSPDIFEAQLRYLRDNGYTALSFKDLVTALAHGSETLPPKPVLLTFDDGWENQYTYAFPLLKTYGMTATFFIFTDVIGVQRHFLTWEEVRALDASGMTIGGHTRSHPYLTRLAEDRELQNEIEGGKYDIERHLGKEVYAFAYPFGQYDDRVIRDVMKAGYKVARGTRRGIYHGVSDDIYTLKSVDAPNDMNVFKNILSR